VSDIIANPFEGADALIEMSGAFLDGFLEVLVSTSKLYLGFAEFSFRRMPLECFA
jgi:hypothetical protein